MTRYLLDASSIIPMVVRYGAPLVAEGTLKHNKLLTMDLAIYESCNSLWKLSTLLKTMTLEDAEKVATVIADLIRLKVVELANWSELNLPSILGLAHEHRLTFYDASYMFAADKLSAILVTEDKKLISAARTQVDTITYAEFERNTLKRTRPSDL